MKPSSPGLLFVERFFITVLISRLVMGLLNCYISSWFSFGKLYFSKNFVHFFQVVHFIVKQLLIVVSFDPLYFCVVCCDFSVFISNFVDLILFPFLLDESGQWFVYFIYLLKEPAFSFVDFCYSLLYFSFISALIFIIYFLLLTLGFFISSFSSCFRCKVRLFI